MTERVRATGRPVEPWRQQVGQALSVAVARVAMRSLKTKLMAAMAKLARIKGAII